jgi:hypothetical protein
MGDQIKICSCSVSFKTLLWFSNSAETQPELLRQNQNWKRSDQPYTQVQKHTEKMPVSK